MSIIKGKITPATKLTGGIKKKKLGLKIHMKPHDALGGANVRPIPTIKASMNPLQSFSGTLRRLDAVFRFIAAHAVILVGRKAKANAAPTVDINAETTIRAAVDAPVKAQPALEVSVDSKPFASVVAALRAYIRRPLTFIKGIALSHIVQPIAAPGAVGRFIKAVKLGRVSKGGVATGAILESRYNEQDVAVGADPDPAPGAIVPGADCSFIAEHEAKPGKASVQTVSKAASVPVVVRAALCSWMLPEVTDDTLTIYQLFSGIQSGDSVEFDMEEESAFWANAVQTGDVLNLVFANTDADGLELI